MIEYEEVEVRSAETRSEGERHMQRSRRFGGAGRRMMRWILANKRFAVIGLIVLILAGVGVSRIVHGYWPWASEEAKAKARVVSVVKEIGKHMIVPSGTPVLATVQDAVLLASQQPFFANAKNGDELVMFPESRQAILYSRSRNVIVNVGPIEYGQDAAAGTTQQESVRSDDRETASVSVEVRNGSGRPGHAGRVADSFRGDSRYSVASVTDTSGSYAETVLIDQTTTPAGHAAAEALAGKLGASVSTMLPSSETGSDADVLVILGSDTAS